jgi:hypothetical protein
VSEKSSTIDGRASRTSALDLIRRYRATAVTLPFAVLASAALVLMFLAVPVCETQLAPNSQPVEVCRHLRITDPPAIVCGLAVLLFLATIFSEVSAFGFTIKRTVEQLQERQELIEEVVEQTQTTASRAEENTRDLYGNLPRPASTEQAPASSIADLESQYDDLRRTMPSGRIEPGRWAWSIARCSGQFGSRLTSTSELA